MKRRLLVMDADATFIQQEQLSLPADEAGSGQQVADITSRMLRGESEFAESLRQRTATLAGLKVDALSRKDSPFTYPTPLVEGYYPHKYEELLHIQQVH